MAYSYRDLNKDQILIDDRPKNGAREFEQELILFGPERVVVVGGVEA